MSKNNIITLVLVILSAGVGFFAGTKYQASKSTSSVANRQFGNQAFDSNRMAPDGSATQGTGTKNNGSQANTRFRAGQVMGEVSSFDDNSITVKTTDGSSKIILISDSTTYTMSSEASKSDLKTGDTIAIVGDVGSDGTITASSVQLNPTLRMVGASQAPQANQ